MLQDIPKQQKEDEELHLKITYENILNSTDLPWKSLHNTL